MPPRPQLKICCQSSQLHRSPSENHLILTPNEINSPNVEGPISDSSDAASDTDSCSEKSGDQTDAQGWPFFNNPDHVPNQYCPGWVHLENPPSPVFDRETFRAEQLRHSINSHEETMDECIDPGPSIENEQYIAPFWILRSENVRCRDCAQEKIADYIYNGNLWTFTLEYKVGVMNKDASIPDGEHIPTEAAGSMSVEVVTQACETQSAESTSEAATLASGPLEPRGE